MSLRLVPSLLILFATLLPGCLAETVDDTPGAALELAGSEQALSSPQLLELRRQARVATVSDVCPPAQQDALCLALHAAEQASDPGAAAQQYAEAGRLVAERIAADPHASALRDPVVRLYVRDRAQALLVHEAVASHAEAAPLDWGARVDGFLARYFPLYASDSLPMAHVFRPAAPSEACAGPRAALVIFPGILRSAEREEFAPQLERIAHSFPCLESVLVDSDTFAPLADNARAGQAAIAALDARVGPLPLHVIGYSQGVTNALTMLATDPALRVRTRSFYALNSAAHGSEVVDVALAALDEAALVLERCDALLPFARPLCQRIARTSLTPVAGLLHAALAALGVSQADLDQSTVAEYVARRRAGFESVSSDGTAAFWAQHGSALPGDILVASFRSVISDEATNLPPGAVPTYAVVAASTPASPFNDMQVRLARQPLSGPFADVEVISHAAEGNHWQWELGPSDLSELAIPHAMLEHMPREALLLAHVQTLNELRLLFPVE